MGQNLWNIFEDTGDKEMNNNDPSQRKNNVSPMTAPDYCLEETSKPEHREGKPRYNLTFYPSWRHKVAGLRRLNIQSLQGRVSREERAAKREKNIWRNNDQNICKLDENYKLQIKKS